MKQTWERIGLMLLAGLLYSINLAAVGVAANHIPPATLTALMLVITSIILAGALYLAKPRYCWHWNGVINLALVGWLNIGLPYLFLAWAFDYISSMLAAVLFNTTPIFTILLAHYCLPDEKLNKAKVLGTSAAVMGATILILSNSSGLTLEHPYSWIGQILIIAGALTTALGLIFMRRRFREENLLVLIAGQILASLVIVAPLALITEGLPTFSAYSWTGWLATMVAAVVGQALSYWLFFYIVNRHSASLASFSGVITPLFSIAIGLLFLGEIVTGPIALGVIFLLVGVWSIHYF